MPDFHSLTPKKKCPPKEAISPNGEYYRFVYHDPPIAGDFCIWILDPGNERFLEERQKKADCPSFAVSMFTWEGVLRKGGLFWRGMGKKAKVRKANFLGWAQVRLDEKSGLFKIAKDHIDLWPFMTCKLEKQVIRVIPMDGSGYVA